MRVPTPVVSAALCGVAAVVLAAPPASAAPAPAGTRAAAVGGSGDLPATPTPQGRPWWRRACRAGELAGVVEPPEGAAGNRYGRLVVTNVGRRTCRLYGYSAMLLRDAAGRALPTRLRAAGNPGPVPVVLRPGNRAAVNLHWTVVAGPGEPTDRPCEPNPASLLVWPPPRAPRPFAVTWPYGPVCQHGLIDVSAYYRL